MKKLLVVIAMFFLAWLGFDVFSQQEEGEDINMTISPIDVE